MSSDDPKKYGVFGAAHRPRGVGISNGMVRSTIEVGVDLVTCASAWDDCVRIVGNVRADEIKHFAMASMAEHDELLAAQARIAELESKLARVRELPGRWTQYGAWVTCDRFAHDLEVALGDEGGGG